MTLELEMIAADVMILPQEPTNLVPVDDATADAGSQSTEKPQILAELVIEEVSIDGMCGVY